MIEKTGKQIWEEIWDKMRWVSETAYDNHCIPNHETSKKEFKKLEKQIWYSKEASK